MRQQKGRTAVRNKAQLLEYCSRFAAMVHAPVRLVLDGVGPDAELSAYSHEFFEAAYSKAVSADAVIERLLFEGRGKFRYRVVTEDRAIAAIAAGTGAAVCSAVEFMAQIDDNNRQQNERLNKEDVRSRGFHRPFEDRL